MTHLVAIDPGGFAERTHDTTEPGTPLRRTWILGWHEAGQLLLAYVLMTGVFALVGWVAFGNDRRWWLVDVDERIARWFASERTDPLNTATLIGSWLSETVTKIAVTAIVVLILLRWLHRWYEALVVAVTLILEAMVFITTTFIVGRDRPPVPHLDGSPVGSSFPSGHVAAAGATRRLRSSPAATAPAGGSSSRSGARRSSYRSCLLYTSDAADE